MMVGHTLFCLLVLFLLNAALYCQHAEDAVLTLSPNWSILFSGESVSFTCDMKEGKDQNWNYTFSRNKTQLHSWSSKTYSLNLSRNDSGEYQCIGRHLRNNVTKQSNKINLTVLDKPRPVLTVSPSWLSPGASVTLNCEVEHSSAGWRFYYYKVVVNLSDKYYRHVLLPGRDNGTEQNSYIIHGQTHTAGYVCRAGRGDTVYYTHHSKPKFVWSGDFDSGSASVKVNPDRVQHFSNESVSLSCEGNSAGWKVMRANETGHRENCSAWGTMTGSICKFNKFHNKTAVYWCESGSGAFSNAINLTIQKKHIILVSPVHPVTEGDSVTLSCKLRNKSFSSNVVFYKNDKLIQNETRHELYISAVSKSDEGFYSCKYSNQESPKSWMSVKLHRPENSSVLVSLICGLVFLLIILLLLLFCYKKSNDSCFARLRQSQRTTQVSASDPVVHQNNTHLHDTDESQDVTYCLIELRTNGKKGNSPPAVKDEAVYSEIQVETALGP